MNIGSQLSVAFRDALLVDGSGPEPAGIVDVLVAVRGNYETFSNSRISG